MMKTQCNLKLPTHKKTKLQKRLMQVTVCEFINTTAHMYTLMTAILHSETRPIEPRWDNKEEEGYYYFKMRSLMISVGSEQFEWHTSDHFMEIIKAKQHKNRLWFNISERVATKNWIWTFLEQKTLL